MLESPNLADVANVRRSWKRRWLERLATLVALPLASVALVTGAFEVGLRIAGYRPIYEIYSKPSLFWEHDELLGWRHQAGATGTYVGPRPWPVEFEARIEINSMGLRGPEIPPPQPGEPRILLLGDSMVAAFEVDYEQTFGAILERELRERIHPHTRVINGGVRGYGTDQSLLFVRERVGELDPDLIVFFHSRNDPTDNVKLHEMRRPFGKPAFHLHDDGHLELVGVPVPHYAMCSEVRLSPERGVVRIDSISSRLFCRGQMAVFDHSALFTLVAISVPWRGPALQWMYRLGNVRTRSASRPGDGVERFPERLTAALVAELAREARARGAGLIVSGFTNEAFPLEDVVAADPRIETVDLEALRNAPREAVNWRHDSHLNPNGHRLVADLLLPHLEKHVRRVEGATPAGQSSR